MRSGLDLRRLGWDLQSKSFNLAQDLVKLRWKDGHLLWEEFYCYNVVLMSLRIVCGCFPSEKAALRRVGIDHGAGKPKLFTICPLWKKFLCWRVLYQFDTGSSHLGGENLN